MKDDVKKRTIELEGSKKTGKQEMIYTLLECHVNLDLEGFEDKDARGLNPTGIKLPYIVTVDETSRKVLSIRTEITNQQIQKEIRSIILYTFKFLTGFRILWLWINSHDWRIE